jgi:hypothetical protein
MDFWEGIPILCRAMSMGCMGGLGALLAFGGIRVVEQPGIFFAILGCVLLFGICNYICGGYSGLKFAENKIKKEDK